MTSSNLGNIQSCEKTEYINKFENREDQSNYETNDDMRMADITFNITNVCYKGYGKRDCQTDRQLID